MTYVDPLASEKTSRKDDRWPHPTPTLNSAINKFIFASASYIILIMYINLLW